MAFLAPVLRWPDALQAQLVRWELLDPDAPPALSPVLLVASTCTLILLTTVLTYALRRTPRGITAQPVSVSAAGSGKYAEGGVGRAGAVRRKQPLSAVLLGPQGAGKTALYATLLYGLTPHTQTSQQASSVTLHVRAGDDRGGGGGGEESGGRRVGVVLHDLPGHPRLRPLGKHVQIVAGADVLFFCIDTVTALGGGSAGSPAETLGATIDYLHTTLMTLARQRLGTSASSRKLRAALPPAVVILLTRADLSPLVAASYAPPAKDKQAAAGATGDDRDAASAAAAAAAAARLKRHQAASAVLLSRARTALETELRKRRAADVDLASAAAASSHSAAAVVAPAAKAKIGGMSEVARGEGEGGAAGVLGQLLSMFGLGALVSSSSKKGGRLAGAGNDDDDDDDDGGRLDRGEEGAGEVPDYYLGASSASSAFSLDRLDPDVVAEGRVPILLSTVGRERGWDVATAAGASTGPAGPDGLAELRRYLVDLAA